MPILLAAMLAAAEGTTLQLPGQPGPVAFTPDGSRLVTCCTDTPAGGGGQVRVWDVKTGKPVGPAVSSRGVGICLAVSPDGKQAVTGGPDGFARIWSLADGKPAAELVCHPQKPGVIGGTRVEAVVFSPDGKRVATLEGDNSRRSTRLWGAATGKLLAEPTVRTGSGAADPPEFAADGTLLPPPAAARAEALDKLPDRDLLLAAARSRDGRRLIAGWGDGVVRLYDGPDLKPVGEAVSLRREAQPSVVAVSLTDDGRRAAALTASFLGGDGLVWAWAAGGKPTEPVPVRGNKWAGLTISPDGRTVAVYSAEVSPTGAQQYTTTVRLIPLP